LKSSLSLDGLLDRWLSGSCAAGAVLELFDLPAPLQTLATVLHGDQFAKVGIGNEPTDLCQSANWTFKLYREIEKPTFDPL
jgi:hypothetical protein